MVKISFLNINADSFPLYQNPILKQQNSQMIING